MYMYMLCTFRLTSCYSWKKGKRVLQVYFRLRAVTKVYIATIHKHYNNFLNTRSN